MVAVDVFALRWRDRVTTVWALDVNGGSDRFNIVAAAA
jgi:hypothetical protein